MLQNKVVHVGWRK